MSSVHLGWRRVLDGARREARTTVHAEVVRDAHQVVASAVTWASQAVEEALSARALEEASVVYETQGYDAAKQVLDRRVHQMQGNAHVGTASRAKIEAASSEAIESFRAAPRGKATKVSRVKAYELAR